MPPKTTAPERRRALDRLRALARQPGERSAFAAELVAISRDPEVLAAALPALREHPLRESHDDLAALYAYLDEQRGRRDPGGHLRTAAVQALRHIATITDSPLFERAAETYEPSPQEGGAPSLLRAAGVVALNQVNEELAAWHAVRLLADTANTSAMSGEPARTAAELLGVMGHGPLLYYLALTPGRDAEVTAECIRAQVDLPPGLLPTLQAAIRGPSTQIAWADLLLAHRDQAACAPLFAGFLRSAADLDVYRYAVTSAIASRRPAIVEALVQAAEHETQRARLAVLADALPLAEGQVDTRELVVRLRRRLGGTPGPDAEDDPDEEAEASL